MQRGRKEKRRLSQNKNLSTPETFSEQAALQNTKPGWTPVEQEGRAEISKKQKSGKRYLSIAVLKRARLIGRIKGDLMEHPQGKTPPPAPLNHRIRNNRQVGETRDGTQTDRLKGKAEPRIFQEKGRIYANRRLHGESKRKGGRR